MHGQAYQGKDAVLYNQLSEVLSAINAFRLQTRLPEDNVVFDAICGDFNFDNLVSQIKDIQLFIEYRCLSMFFFLNVSIGSPQAIQLHKTIHYLTSTSTSVQKVTKLSSLQ